MMDLRSYMSSEYFVDNQIVVELDEVLLEVSETFCKTHDETTKSWPYALRTATSLPVGSDSQSTSAMVLCAVLAMLDVWASMPNLRASSGSLYWPDFKLPKALCGDLVRNHSTGRSPVAKATKKLFDRWRANVARRFVTESTTFGRNDPMLLGWVIDLLRYSQSQQPLNREDVRLFKHTVNSCLRQAEGLGKATARNEDGGAFDNRTLCRSLMNPSEGRLVGDSSYILLRFAIILRSLKSFRRQQTGISARQMRAINRANDILYERFEARLHEQLSFAEIVDSRFDATESIFCLEGMLLIQPDGVSKTLFDRIMSVLRDVQGSDGFWRSETPMVYNQKGEVLFTVSVESANSILASFALYDERWSLHDSIGSEHIDLIKRYWKWLKARKSSVRIAGYNLKGWHSEHVNDPDLIHLWETSQVAEFLVNFRDQLKRHIARKSLALSGCSYKKAQRPEPIKDRPRMITPDDRWKEAIKLFEPVTGLGNGFKIYERVGDSFVKQRQSATAKQKYSMLLFGPPGTGKTTVASTLAWALDYRLITVTVSDFLADGHAAIEARAKDLFDMLRAQPRSVVLFDETDQFMLDRDSEYFREQETVFQFLTPGMLTKLNDLRSSESVIFIMATNYAERIDAAIKRQGRIDEHYLLLPPDKKRRRTFVTSHWGRRVIDVNAAARDSVFLGYNDIKSVKKEVVGNNALQALKVMPRAAKPEMYVNRFNDKSGKRLRDLSRTPLDEFFAMILLDADALGLRKGSVAWKKHVKTKCLTIFENKNVAKIEEALTDFLNRL
jgi:hypothetical protein